MRKFYSVAGGEELIKGLQPVYTEINYLCLKPIVLLIQRGNNYYIGELKHRTFDFASDLTHIGANTYLRFSEINIIKNKGIVYNSYSGNICDGKKVEIMQLLGEDEGKYIAGIEFDSPKDYLEFEKPSFLISEIRSEKDFNNKGIVLRKSV